MSEDLYERTLAAPLADGHVVEQPPETVTLRLEEDGLVTFVLVLEPADALVCYTVLPSFVDSDRLTSMSHLATLANAELHLSALELDVKAAAFSARTALGCQRLADVDDELFKLLVADLVAETRWAYRRHLPAIEAVLAGMPPDEALELRV